MKKLIIVLCVILWPLNLLLNKDNISINFETIFKKDYQAQELVYRNINLYPNTLLARTFQNKPRIYINKYMANFFILTDPNYYFFASHPEPLPGKINFVRYPFLAIFLFLTGIININKIKYKKLIIWSGLILISLLSIFVNFEGLDFVLWLPISLLVINGIHSLERFGKKFFTFFFIVFILFTFPELIRSFYLR